MRKCTVRKPSRGAVSEYGGVIIKIIKSFGGQIIKLFKFRTNTMCGH